LLLSQLQFECHYYKAREKGEIIGFPEFKLFNETEDYTVTPEKNTGKYMKCTCNKQVCGKVLMLMIKA